MPSPLSLCDRVTSILRWHPKVSLDELTKTCRITAIASAMLAMKFNQAVNRRLFFDYGGLQSALVKDLTGSRSAMSGEVHGESF
uniref:Uncharacterized protein n=1 Tax=Chromera velia CCMP2878 TaxID=1169474 RepID=A0A0G4IDZ0_9ALVE|eukprot:Cvel_2345.t1-p1 / transcript=Cvel_2345.t1 / gene=Cvel_2345 / organism=Chromera_velia_CCMP2878 / gene_product=hypothetical protein / transcript_product=hypothetical protein / location=Cvel_scaffold91:6406-7514(-) / protein_length=83 / sequence_SO=supercontig / SO=protein_coding / is_pseudo=false